LDSLGEIRYPPNPLRRDHARASPAASRNPRSADPEGGVPRSASWLRRSPAHRANLRAGAVGRAGRALSRIVPAGAPGASEGKLGPFGHEPAGQVLRVDGVRAQALAGGDQRVGPSGRRHRLRPRRHPGGNMRFTAYLRSLAGRYLYRSRIEEEMDEEL